MTIAHRDRGGDDLGEEDRLAEPVAAERGAERGGAGGSPTLDRGGGRDVRFEVTLVEGDLEVAAFDRLALAGEGAAFGAGRG